MVALGLTDDFVHLWPLTKRVAWAPSPPGSWASRSPEHAKYQGPGKGSLDVYLLELSLRAEVSTTSWTFYP